MGGNDEMTVLGQRTGATDRVWGKSEKQKDAEEKSVKMRCEK